MNIKKYYEYDFFIFLVIFPSKNEERTITKNLPQKTKPKQNEIVLIDEILSVSSTDSTNNYIEPEFVEVVPIKTEPEFILDELTGTLTDTTTKNIINTDNSGNNPNLIQSEFIEIPVKQELTNKLSDETNFDQPGNNFIV